MREREREKFVFPVGSFDFENRTNFRLEFLGTDVQSLCSKLSTFSIDTTRSEQQDYFYRLSSSSSVRGKPCSDQSSDYEDHDMSLPPGGKYFFKKKKFSFHVVVFLSETIKKIFSNDFSDRSILGEGSNSEPRYKKSQDKGFSRLKGNLHSASSGESLPSGSGSSTQVIFSHTLPFHPPH